VVERRPDETSYCTNVEPSTTLAERLSLLSHCDELIDGRTVGLP
jgi:hypothetical protein